MKILKIVGIVLGAHLVGGILLIAIPGCHATSRKSQRRAAQQAPAKPAEAPDASSAAQSASPSMNQNDLNPGVPSSEPITFGNDAPRWNPTRPKTPEAVALQTPAPSGVTPAKRYTIQPGDTLGKIAQKHDITARELAKANNMAVTDPIRPGKALLIPAKTPPQGPAAGTHADVLTYKVKRGETLEQIARRSGTTVATIKSLNKLTNNSLKAGQDLLLPAGGNATAALAAADVEAAPKASQSTTKYVVQPNESLNSIASKFGVRVSELVTLNNIANPKAIRAGQELTIPVPAGKAARQQTPAAQPQQPAPQPPEPVSPISPAPESPITTPVDPAPPVNRVEEAPIAPAPSQ